MKDSSLDMASPVLITGAARSGTSLIAGIISACGAFGGDLAGPNRWNKKGQFENRRIVKSIVKPFLSEKGFDPMCQNPLPDINEMHKNIDLAEWWRNSVINVFKNQRYPGGQWFYKGAKICLMWPIWHAAFLEAKWIIVRRNAEDIVRSCLRTGFMRAYETRSGWLGWVAIHEQRFEEMVEAKLQVQEVWPQRIVNGDLREIHQVINNLGLDWNEDKIRGFVEPKLWAGGRDIVGRSEPV